MIKKLSLVSGLLIFISISSLYAEVSYIGHAHFRMWNDDNYKMTLYCYTNKDIMQKQLKLYSNEKYDKVKPDLKIKLEYQIEKLKYEIIFRQKNFTNYQLYLADGKGREINNLTNYSKSYAEYGKNMYAFFLSVSVSMEDLIKLDYKDTYIYFKINDKNYRKSLYDLYFDHFLDKMKNVVSSEQKRKEEEYKKSPEYRLQQRKNVINNLSKKYYDIKKDDFDNRIHITSKRLSSKFDNNSINILKANNLFIVPRCEVNSENYSPSFGMTITQMSSENKGVNYLKGVSFSNREDTVTIRVGTVSGYAIGEVGKYISINGFMNAMQLTTRISEGYIRDLYKLFSKNTTIKVRIHAGEWTYDTKISELERLAFLDILKIYIDTDNAFYHRFD